MQEVWPMLILAHRGVVDRGRSTVENTMGAFLLAAERGADGVELDVRVTRDGALVVHHDPTIGDLGPIADLSAPELPDSVPLLADVLTALPGLFVNIEVKNLFYEPGYDPDEVVARSVADLVTDLGMEDRVVISSFGLPTLVSVLAVEPRLPTALLVPAWLTADGGLTGAVDHELSGVHLHHTLVTASVVDAAHQRGLDVGAWTVNDPAVVVAMAGAGVDRLITDDVAAARDALGGTG
jgi:glycerophosphoryl diester phosphodiesterase